jgi:hypothetical protein
MFGLLVGSGELFRGFLSPAAIIGHTTPWPGQVRLGRRAREAATNGWPLVTRNEEANLLSFHVRYSSARRYEA